jgi:hypothetical protein
MGSQTSNDQDCTPSAGSIRSLSLKRSCATAIMERAVERVALNYALNAGSIDPPSKRQHVPGLRSNHQVLFVNCAFHAARLIRPFEMTFDHRPLLLKIQVLRGCCSVRILAVQSPFAGHIRRLLLRGRLLPKRRAYHRGHQSKTKQENRIKIPPHSILRSSDSL